MDERKSPHPAGLHQLLGKLPKKEGEEVEEDEEEDEEE